jgi:Helix-turn-helix domain
MPQEDSLQNKSKLWALMIIDSRVDDAQLSPPAFRVYSHLCRRSDKEHVAWPGIDSISKICRVNKKTAIMAVRELEDRGFLKASRLPGRTTNYEILPIHCWRTVTYSAPVPKVYQCKKSNAPLPKLHHPSVNEVTPPVQNEERKVSIEGVQKKESKEEIPESLRTEAFLSSWELWDQHRKKGSKRKEWTDVARKIQLKHCAGWGPEKAIIAIENSIQSGWQGLFDPGVKPSQKSDHKLTRDGKSVSDMLSRLPEHLQKKIENDNELPF